VIFQDLYAFTDLYDSVIQQNVDQSQQRDAHMRAFHGRLRVDLALRSRLMLSDTQVLDGRFFVFHLSERANDEEWQLINRHVAVRAREDSLTHSRLGFCRNDAGSRREFVFSLLEESERALVYGELTQPGAEFRWPDIASMFRDLGVERSLIERVEAGWRRLDEKLTSIQKWNTHDDHLGFRLDRYGLEDFNRFLAQPRSAESCEVLKRVYEGRRMRSHVDRLIQAEIATAPSPQARHEIRTIEDWYHRGYNRALGRSHGARAIECVRAGPATALRLEFKESVFELNAGICESVSSIPTADFAHLIESLSADIAGWRETWEASRLRDILGRLVDACGEPKHSELREPAPGGHIGATKAFEVLGGCKIVAYSAPIGSARPSGPLADVRAVTELRRGDILHEVRPADPNETIALVEHRDS
jgi:hypothetical protein